MPYLVRGGDRFFARKEVRDAILLLRGAARSDDGDKPLGEIARDVITGAGWSHEPPSGGGATRERWESLTALATLADDIAAAAPEARLPELVAELDRRAAEQHAPAVQGVTLASLHAAKGLEWDTVFLVGASDGLMPISMAEGPDAIEEERRLLYVGLTRARKQLFLSWSGARTPGRPCHAPRLALPRPGRRHPRSGRAQRGPLRWRPSGPRRRWPASRTAAAAAPSSSPRRSARPAAATTARPPTTRRRSSGCAPGGWPSRARRACRHTSSSPTRRSPRSPRARPPTRAVSSVISGVGARKLEQYGSDVLADPRVAPTRKSCSKVVLQQRNPPDSGQLRKNSSENFVK